MKKITNNLSSMKQQEPQRRPWSNTALPVGISRFGAGWMVVANGGVSLLTTEWESVLEELTRLKDAGELDE